MTASSLIAIDWFITVEFASHYLHWLCSDGRPRPNKIIFRSDAFSLLSFNSDPCKYRLTQILSLLLLDPRWASLWCPPRLLSIPRRVWGGSAALLFTAVAFGNYRLMWFESKLYMRGLVYVFGWEKSLKWKTGKEKKKGFLLSIDVLLMYHITPEPKYQEVAETIKLYSIHLIQ